MRRPLLVLAAVLMVGLSAAPVGATKVYINPSIQTANVSPDGTYQEGSAMQDVADRTLTKLQNRGFEVKNGGWRNPWAAADDAYTWGANCFVALHTNAMGSGWQTGAIGTETFYDLKSNGWYLAGSKDIAQRCLNKCIEKFNWNGWGRGYYRQLIGNDLGITAYWKLQYIDTTLVEAMFHDNPYDVAVLKSAAGKDAYAQAVYEAVCDHYGLTYTAWGATYRAQSYPTVMQPGSTTTAWVEFTNTGSAHWEQGYTFLGTQGPQDRNSPFYTSGNWNNAGRPADADQSEVGENEVGRFTFVLTAPTTPGTYVEKFRLVQEHTAWFGDEITWTIQVIPSNMGIVTGTVRDNAYGAPVSGAAVSLSNGAATTSASDGTYSLAAQQSGTYTLSVSKAGFSAYTDTVTLSTGSTITKDITLAYIDTTPPSTPSLAGDATDYNTAHLNWTASADNIGVQNYELWRNGALTATIPANQTSYDDTTLTHSTGYTYQIRAKDFSGNFSNKSASISLKTWAIAAQDSFQNLNQWTAATIADGSVRGVSLDTIVGSDLAGGSGAPSARADAGLSNTIGSYSYIGFGAPFGVGYIECSYRDTSSSNPQRAGIAFRKFLNDDINQPRLAYFMGADGPNSQTEYSSEVFSASASWDKNSTTVARSAGWKRFKISIDGTNAKFYINGVLKDTIAEPAEKNEGCNRFYIGFNYNVNATAWFDDFKAVFPIPSTPTMSNPYPFTTNSITWNFTEGRHDWEQGFYIRDSSGDLKYTGSRHVNSITETGLAPNTRVTRTVSAFNGTFESAPSASVSVTTLCVPPSSSSISSTPAPGVWTNGVFTFRSLPVFGPGGVYMYRYKLDQNPTYSWPGSEAQWKSGDLVMNAGTNGSWYLHLKAYNSEMFVNGTYDLGPLLFDDTPPVISSATDDGTWTASTSKLHFSWTAPADSGSEIAGYEYAIGTTAGGTDVRGWTAAGTANEFTASELTLTEEPTYYASVRAIDAAGNVGAVISTDGIGVAPLVNRISDAKMLAENAACRLIGKLVIGKAGSVIYIEELDRSSAIGILPDMQVNAGAGDFVDIAGVISGSGAERLLMADYVESAGSATHLKPLYMSVSRIGGGAFGSSPGAVGGVGLQNVGMLIATAGLVSESDSTTGAQEFRLSDGGGSILVNCPGFSPPANGAFVRIVGIVRLDASFAPIIAVKAQSDITDVL